MESENTQGGGSQPVDREHDPASCANNALLSGQIPAIPALPDDEPEIETAKPQEMTARQQNYSETAPISARSILVRAFQRTGGRSNAIKAKCLSCANFDRDEIRHCTVEACPLHSFRPFQAKTA